MKNVGRLKCGRFNVSRLATVPKIKPTAKLPNTRRSSNRVWSTCGRSNAGARPEDSDSGRIPRRNATRKSRFEATESESSGAAT